MAAPEHDATQLILTDDIKEGALVVASDGTTDEILTVGPVTLIEYVDGSQSVWYHTLAHTLGVVPTKVYAKDTTIFINTTEAIPDSQSVSGNNMTTTYTDILFPQTRTMEVTWANEVKGNSMVGFSSQLLKVG